MNDYPYCSCIAIDVINSENIKDKGMMRKKLRLIANELNKSYQDSLYVPFGVRQGDELIGVVDTFAKGFKVFQDIRVLAWEYDISMYFGLGLGRLETGKVTNLHNINGSAIINAFRARDIFLKQNKSLYINPKDNVRFYAKGDPDFPTSIINVMVYNIYSGHTTKQQEAINLYESNPDLTYEELGERLGYDEYPKENVGKLFKRAKYKLYKNMQEELIDFLIQLQNILSSNEKEGGDNE